MGAGNAPRGRFYLEALAREGLDHVFMVPGGLSILSARFRRQEALTPIVAAQEGGTAYMADG
jgi:acetolactate synthase-1/2/3 large subunit